MARDGFFIGTLAERTGLSPDTIRYYEDEGVLPEPERTESGYRVYGREAVERLRFVRQAQTLGLHLEEIAEILALVEDRDVEPCAHVEARLRERLSTVRDRIRELEELRERLRGALRRAEATPGRDAEACRCRIIEGVDGENGTELGGVGEP